MKNDLAAEEKVMFQGFRRHCKIISGLSAQPKMRFVGGTESDD
jgi:hypothetical protein